MKEQASGLPGIDASHFHRFQFIDPFADAKYLFYSAGAALKKVQELGAGVFQYVPREDEFIQVGEIDGRWQAYRFERGAGSPRVPIVGETLEVIQRREETWALQGIEDRGQAAAFSDAASDAKAEQARATADAAALRRIDDPLLRREAAVLIDASARVSKVYRAQLDAAPFLHTAGDVAQLLAQLEAQPFDKDEGKRTILEQAANAIEGVALEAAASAQPPEAGLCAAKAVGPALDPALTQSLIEGFDQRGKDFFFKGTDRKAFSDKGGRVTSRLEDRETIAGMLSCAEIKGWRNIQVRGTESFRRQAWYAAKQRGLEVSGYEPTHEEAALFPAKPDQEAPKQTARPENSVEPAPVSAGAGAPTKPLPPEAERAGIMGPTRVEASLDEARKQIADALGDKAQVFRAETRSGSYRGEVIAETQMHVVQRISGRMAVIHNRVDVAGGIIGQRGVYAYKGGRAQFAANREQQLMKSGLER